MMFNKVLTRYKNERKNCLLLFVKQIGDVRSISSPLLSNFRKEKPEASLPQQRHFYDEG